jgi:hypothetical protein
MLTDSEVYLSKDLAEVFLSTFLVLLSLYKRGSSRPFDLINQICLLLCLLNHKFVNRLQSLLILCLSLHFSYQSPHSLHTCFLYNALTQTLSILF